MIWLTWRQHRIEVLAMGILLLGFAVALLVAGINIALEAQRVGFIPCTNTTETCLQVQGAMQRYVNGLTQTSIFTFVSLVLPSTLPALSGIFIGAPALAREFEQGTYRLLWTQSIPWPRWFFKKTGLLICTVTCAFAILSGLFSGWSALLFAPLSQTGWFYGLFNSRFDTWGVVSVAYAVFAVALGLFLGAMMRKPVAAMALTLVIFVVVRVLVTNYWRPYYLPPVALITPMSVNTQIPPGSWPISLGIVDRQGQPVSTDATSTCNKWLSSPDASSQIRYLPCMTAHGFQHRAVYQPPDRFWLFQWIEGGIYLLCAAILIALTWGWTKYGIIGREKRSS